MKTQETQIFRARTLRQCAEAALVSALVTVELCYPSPSWADVVADGSSGSLGAIEIPSSVEMGDQVFHITEDFGDRSGSNLFYSFSDFDLASDQVASFEPDLSAPLGTSLILARITSVDSMMQPRMTTIAGTIRLESPGTRLLLVNSAGISFLEGARLDLSGSLIVSTADEVRFAEAFGLPDTVVPTRSLDPIQLTSASPTAFGFFGDLGAIDISVGLLQLEQTANGGVPNSLMLVGNSVSIRSVAPTSRTLRSFGGRIEIAAIPNETVVPLEVESIDLSIFENATDAVVDLQGDAIQLVLEVGSFPINSQPPGAIVIRGGRVQLVNTRLAIDNISTLDALPSAGIDIRADVLTLDGASLQSFTQSGGRAAGIRIGANEIELRGVSEISMVSLDGASADILIEGLELGQAASDIQLAEESRIFSTALGADRGGDITILADRLSLAGFDTGISAATEATGMSAGVGGDVRLEVGGLTILDGAQVAAATFGDGDAGMLEVTATEFVRIEGRSGSRPSALASTSGQSPSVAGSGAGGFIYVDAPLLEIENGGEVTARSFGDGSAGEILLEGLDRLTVRGGPLGASSITVRSTHGDAGDIEIRSARLELLQGGRVTSSTSGTSDAGNLTIRADEILIEGSDPAFSSPSGLFALTNPPLGGGAGGSGGRIEIRGARTVELRDGGVIESTSLSQGDAGEIVFLSVDRILLSGGSGIRSRADNALGGNITIEGTRQIQLRGGSEITTSVASGVGAGGNIEIDSRILALEESRIVADADAGNGGQINIRSLLVTRSGLSPDATQTVSRITASSRLAFDGTVQILTPDADLTGSLAPLAEERLLDDPLRATPCDVLAPRASRSRLQIGSKGRKGPVAGDWLPSWASAGEDGMSEAHAEWVNSGCEIGLTTRDS